MVMKLRKNNANTNHTYIDTGKDQSMLSNLFPILEK